MSSKPTWAHPVEGELARLLDEVGVHWEYEPREFVLARDDEGRVTEAFVPDFYLPELDVYVECTTMRQKLTTKKNRKMRLAQELYGVTVIPMYRRDFERLTKYGLQLAAA